MDFKNYKLGVFFTVIFLGGPSHSFAGVVGQVGLIEGEVLLDGKPVSKVTRVSDGAVVEVKDGHATLTLGRGSVFQLASHTKMVVTHFTVASVSEKSEQGEIDLKFGRTRALIFNNGVDKREIKIKARAATMGVRGTEVYVNAPQNQALPVEFFTLEGRAEVSMSGAGRPISLPQNQGLKTDGSKSSSSEKVKAEIHEARLDGTRTETSRISSGKELDSVLPGTLSNSVGLTPLPPVRYDPVQDGTVGGMPLNVRPRFCNPSSGACN